ncbi:MAG TPA: peptide chain release factor N(5)-glutamine methyltransferase [Leucothrix sp.]|nr:peptide chain release factor N(5)-glutamine methyltransferase [Leucothrix sp.]
MNEIGDVLKQARDQLNTVSDSPALDAELLLAHCLNKNQTYLHTWPEQILTADQQKCFLKLIEKRLTNYPVAYLLGIKHFWTLGLIVTPDVLIPRPETELLVEIALENIKDIAHPKILDLGTGSGAIALALASERDDAEIIACDFSSRALKIAKLNGDKNKLSGKVTFIESNWFSNITDNDFDLIVSNPPYIDPLDPHLLESIRYEPQQALVANNKGLEDIEIIISDSKNHLKKGGFLIVEHGYNQDKIVLHLFNYYGLSHQTSCYDLNHIPRVSFAQKV